MLLPCSPAVMARDTAKLPGRMLTLRIEGFANYLCPTFGRKLPSLGYEDSLWLLCIMEPNELLLLVDKTEIRNDFYIKITWQKVGAEIQRSVEDFCFAKNSPFDSGVPLGLGATIG